MFSGPCSLRKKNLKKKHTLGGLSEKLTGLEYVSL